MQDDTKPPSELLWGVSWTFRGEPFADRTEFDAAVAGYQNPDRGEVWKPAEVCLQVARVRISPDVHWYLSDDEPVAELTADDGVAFTASELLYKVHNFFVADLRQMDHKYFEGFSLAMYQESGQPLLFK